MLRLRHRRLRAGNRYPKPIQPLGSRRSWKGQRAAERSLFRHGV